MPGQSWNQERISEDATKGRCPDSSRDGKNPNARAVFRQILSITLPGAAIWDQVQPDRVRGVWEPARLPLGAGKPHVWVPEVRAGRLRRLYCYRLRAPRPRAVRLFPGARPPPSAAPLAASVLLIKML